MNKRNAEDIAAILAAANKIVEAVLADPEKNVELPFKPENVEVLAALKEVAPDKWQRLRITLKSVKVVKISDLDKLIDRRLRERAAHDGLAGEAVGGADEETWPEPVNGTELLDDLAAFFRRHAVLPPHAATVLSLWGVAAHAYDCFDVFPRLGIGSPVMRCGKTQVVKQLKYVLPRAMVVDHASGPFIFRVIEKSHPTLIFDETDNYLPHNLELRPILNSSHERETAYVGRTVGDNHEPRAFSTWAPMVFSGIGELTGTLADRSIRIMMHRAPKGASVTKFRPRRDSGAATALKQRAARWAVDNAAALTAWEGELHEDLFNRIADNWLPLFAVAELAGGEWRKRAEEAALADATEVADTDEYRELVLGDLLEIFADFNARFEREHATLPTATLLHYLHLMEERPWSAYGKSGKPISSVQLGKLLKPFRQAFGVQSKQVRYYDDETDLSANGKCYEREPIAKAYLHYHGTPFRPETPETSEEEQGFNSDFASKQSASRFESEKAENSNDFNDVSGVSGLRGGLSERLRKRQAEQEQEKKDLRQQDPFYDLEQADDEVEQAPRKQPRASLNERLVTPEAEQAPRKQPRVSLNERPVTHEAEQAPRKQPRASMNKRADTHEAEQAPRKQPRASMNKRTDLH